ncbi:MAG: M48 family metallopeptidase [Cyanobacteria bacterium P01_E01_bin.34]
MTRRSRALKFKAVTLVLSAVFAFTLSGPLAVQAFDWEGLLQGGFRAIQLSNLSDDDEVKLGRDINRQLLESGELRLANNPRLTQRVNRIGERLVRVSDRPDLPFIFQVVQDNGINAFATAGGYVYITTGAIAAADTNAQLASVLAHEIAHITESHVVQQMQRMTFAQAGAQLLGVDDSILVATGVELGFRRPRSRQAEYEADAEGLAILTRAGYNPRGMTQFMQKLLGNGAPPQFISTHPHTAERIERLEEAIHQK